MNKKKGIWLIIGIILIVVIAIFTGYTINDAKQRELLKQEVTSLSNKDLLKDDYKIEIKTTGDYAYIEEAIKKFYQELAISIQTINMSLNDEKLTNILSADNLKEDGPHFQNSYQLLEESKKSATDALNTIASLCEEEKILSLIDQKKVSSRSYNLYKELMYTEEDLKEFKEIKDQMETLSSDLNTFLDKVKEILNFLEQNSNSWTIENNQIYFDQNSQVQEYNRLYQELQTIAKRFSSSNQSLTTNNSKQNA